MTRSAHRRRASAAFAALGAVTLLVAAPSGRQDAPVGRQLLGEAALPAIDRGLAPDAFPTEPIERIRRAELAVDADGEPRGSFDAGSVLVKFRDDTVTTRQQALRAVGGERLARPSSADFDVMALSPSANPEEAAAALAALPGVEYAQPRYRQHAMLTPSDPFYSFQWNFPAIPPGW